MKSIEFYYKEASKSIENLQREYSQQDISEVSFGLTILWKKYCEWEGLIELNETNDKKSRLLAQRIPEYLDFIDNTLDCMETKKALMDKFEELFGVLNK